MARLVPEAGTGDACSARITAPGEIIVLAARRRERASDLIEFVALLSSSRGLEIAEYVNEKWAVLADPIQPNADLDWAGFSWTLEGTVQGVALALNPDTRRPADGRLSSAVVFESGPSGHSLHSIDLDESLDGAVVLTDRAACAQRGRIMLSAQAPGSRSPAMMHLTLGKTRLSGQPQKDMSGHTISFGHDVGFVESGVYTGFGLGMKNGLVWAKPMGTPGAAWRSPADWDPNSAAYAFDGALAAGTVGTGSGTYLVAADLTEGPGRCDAGYVKVSDTERTVLGAALENDVFWQVSREHGEHRVRWFYLPSFGDLHA
ncbi:MAG: hypothetical protein ACJAYU_004827 [Bradymonadia bacterium]